MKKKYFFLILIFICILSSNYLFASKHDDLKKDYEELVSKYELLDSEYQNAVNDFNALQEAYNKKLNKLKENAQKTAAAVPTSTTKIENNTNQNQNFTQNPKPEVKQETKTTDKSSTTKHEFSYTSQNTPVKNETSQNTMISIPNSVTEKIEKNTIINTKSEITTVQKPIASPNSNTKKGGKTTKKTEQTIENNKNNITDNSFEIVSQLSFDLERSELNDVQKNKLNNIIDTLKNIDNKQIIVEGHTDNIPVKKNSPSNLELSAARAVNTANYLIEKGIDRKKIAVSGYSDTKPIAFHDTDYSRGKNRRVAIILIPMVNEQSKIEAQKKFTNYKN